MLYYNAFMFNRPTAFSYIGILHTRCPPNFFVRVDAPDDVRGLTCQQVYSSLYLFIFLFNMKSYTKYTKSNENIKNYPKTYTYTVNLYIKKK